MDYETCKSILKRDPKKSRGYWAIHVCSECDCNFQVYNTCISSAWNCPNCKSDNILRIRSNKVKDGDLNRSASEFIDMIKFDKTHQQIEKKGSPGTPSKENEKAR